MTNNKHAVRNFIFLLLGIIAIPLGLCGQENFVELSGKVLESGSGAILNEAVVSISSTGEFTNTDQEGNFTLRMPTPVEQIIISYPGYHSTSFYTTGQTELIIYLTRQEYTSEQEVLSTPLGTKKLRDATNSVNLHSLYGVDKSAVSSSDQILTGQIPGLHIVEHSGMPGHSSWINLRGISSVFARNQPIVYIDGMIHEINFANNYRIEGHLFNPFDVIDIDDVVDFTAIKTGEGYLGSAGSNGVLFINTEQKGETSSSILIKMYGGIALPPCPSGCNECGTISYLFQRPAPR